MEIRWSSDRLIFIMGFPILVRCHLYIESWPSALAMELLQSCAKLLILPLQTNYEMPSVKPLQKLIV